jgi:hypothetical protein
MPLAAGNRLDPFEVLAFAGASGKGEVYRATDTKLGRVRALNVPPSEMAQDAERLAPVRREPKAFAQLDQPNRVNVIKGFRRRTKAWGLQPG